jgi:GNAT superfamily N-acetyltransferase
MSKTIATLWQVMGEANALYYRDAPSLDARLTPSAWLVTTGERVPELNLGFIGGGPGARDALDEIGRAVLAKSVNGVPAFVMLGAGAEELAPAALALGLTPAGSMPLMTYLEDGVHPSPSRYRVEPVTTEAGLADSHRLAAAGLGMSLEALSRAVGPRVLDAPGATLFLAYDGHRPVSTLTTMRAGPLVGAFCMATAPEDQRRGAGKALMEHAIAHHRDRGARLFYLLATEAGVPLYTHVGFRAADTAAVFAANAR